MEQRWFHEHSESLYDKYYLKLVGQIKDDLDRQLVLPLNVAGQAGIIKMNGLPRFHLYYYYYRYYYYRAEKNAGLQGTIENDIWTNIFQDVPTTSFS